MICSSPRVLGRRLRRKAYHLAYRRRHLRLTSHQQVKSRNLRRIFLTMMVLSKRKTITGRRKKKIKQLLKLSAIKYLNLVCYDDEEEKQAPNRRRDIDSFTASECRLLFRFHQDHLKKLIVLLEFPDECILCNGLKMRGEEVFLRGLYELSGGENQLKISSYVFGRDGTAQSRAFKNFINHMYENFKHLVTDNLSWWYRNGFFASSASAIADKLGLEETQSMIAFFIYCNCLETNRCGGGPAANGANASRWDPNIQASFFNGTYK